MKNFVLTAIIGALITAGCSNSKKSTNTAVINIEDLYQIEWKLSELQGATVPANSKASLGFTAGEPVKVSGNTGCNRMTGTVELSKTGTIQFSPLATTRMACIDNGIVELENNFLAVLANSNSWRLNNNELILSNGNTVLAKLENHKAPITQEASLNGAWELNYISGTKIAFEGLFPNKKPTIIFDLAKEEVNGNGGCNGYSCKVKIAGNAISFGDALSTMMACEGNGEPVYFKTLKTVTAYSISDNTLTMIMGDIAVMRFSRK